MLSQKKLKLKGGHLELRFSVYEVFIHFEIHNYLVVLLDRKKRNDFTLLTEFRNSARSLPIERGINLGLVKIIFVMP